jgi:hypothetical protein
MNPEQFSKQKPKRAGIVLQPGGFLVKTPSLYTKKNGCKIFAKGLAVPEHLQAYLEEFTFRFNRRTSRRRGLVFRRLLERAVATGPVTENYVTHRYN